jgi:hypothetical protein
MSKPRAGSGHLTQQASEVSRQIQREDGVRAAGDALECITERRSSAGWYNHPKLHVAAQ